MEEGQMSRIFFFFNISQHSWRGGRFLSGFWSNLWIWNSQQKFSVLLWVFEALFDFHGRSDLFHTPQPGRPAVPQPPVPVRPYQADKNLCLLPRKSGPGGCGGGRGFLSGFIYPAAGKGRQVKASQVGFSERAVSSTRAPPACFHLRFHHSYQTRSTTDREDTSKAKL